jgi:DNA-binding Lrp family transcriptional regulator
MTRYLVQFGPNINEVARLTGLHPETVRYRYRNFLLAKGITIQAVPNYAKLGFGRLVVIARLAPAFEKNAKSVFGILSDLCYLRSYTRVMLDGEFVLHVALPTELIGECTAVYESLQEMGLFTGLEMMKFEEIRNPPMDSEYYDFVRGTWACDWDCMARKRIKLPLTIKPKTAKYDKLDLLILKELDIDASRKLVRMATNLGMSLHALEFHYREHVMARDLVKNYKLVWQEPRQETIIPKKDSYMGITLILKGATGDEIVELMQLLNRTPFLWSEACGSEYCGELFLPSYAYPEFTSYIDEFARRLRGKLRILIMDPNQSQRFTLSYSLFDGLSKKWTLDGTAVLKSLGLVAMPNSYPSSTIQRMRVR